jgi:phasin
MATTTKKPMKSETPILEPKTEMPAFEPIPVTAQPANVTQIFDAASAPVREMQENVRKVAEKGVEETRAAYARVKAAAEEATGSLETSYSTASKGIVEFNTKALEAVRTNTEATFDFINALFNVKSVSEAVTLQSEHARKQYEALSSQTKDLANLAQKVATDAAEPIKATVARTFSVAR